MWGVGSVTVKPLTREIDVASGFVTVTVRAPRVALIGMLIVAMTSFSEGTSTCVTFTPVPKLTVAPVWKLAPAIVTSRVSPWPPRDGVIVPISGVVASVARAWNTRIRGFVIPVLGSVTGSPVETSAFWIWSTVAVGAACFRVAQAPGTCGAAAEVPSAVVNPPRTVDDVIDSPGANRVRKDATFEKYETSSVSPVEPTLTAEGTQAGEASASRCPSFPEATMDTMPAERSVSMAGFWTSFVHGDVKASPPRLRLAATMLNDVRSV